MQDASAQTEPPEMIPPAPMHTFHAPPQLRIACVVEPAANSETTYVATTASAPMET